MCVPESPGRRAVASATLRGGRGMALGMPVCCLALWGTWEYTVFGKEWEQHRESRVGRYRKWMKCVGAEWQMWMSPYRGKMCWDTNIILQRSSQRRKPLWLIHGDCVTDCVFQMPQTHKKATVCTAYGSQMTKIYNSQSAVHSRTGSLVTIQNIPAEQQIFLYNSPTYDFIWSVFCTHSENQHT